MIKKIGKVFSIKLDFSNKIFKKEKNSTYKIFLKKIKEKSLKLFKL